MNQPYKVILFSIFSLLSLTLKAQECFYKVKSVHAEDTELKSVNSFTIDGRTYTAVVLHFTIEEGFFRPSRLHPPGTEGAFYLRDKQGNRYALLGQEGWKGSGTDGFGRMDIEENFDLKLIFEPFNYSDSGAFDLIEGNAEEGWSFYNITCSDFLTKDGIALAMLKTRSKNYYSNGQLKSIGDVNEEGDRIWKWEVYHNNGIIATKGEYTASEGHKIGKWLEYYNNGQLKEEGKYEIIRGKSYKKGDFLTYWPSGGLKRKANYYYGEKNGAFTSYYESGKIEEELTDDYKYSMYFPDGSVSISGQYDNRQKTGDWNIYYPNGKVKSEINYDDYPYFFSKEYNESGQLSQISYSKIENDTVKSIEKRKFLDYDENGQFITYVDYAYEEPTRLVKVLERYDTSTVRKAYTEFKNYEGVVEKEFMTYFENGDISSRCNINENGNLHGHQVFYYGNGNIIQALKVENGKFLEVVKCYDIDGNEQKKGTLNNGNGTVITYNPETGEESGKWVYKNGERID